MYKVLDKDTIKFEILPQFVSTKTQLCLESDLLEAIQHIHYKIKTGCQWHIFSVSSIFTGTVLHYKAVYEYSCEWSGKVND